jgi:hypothetical protein
MKSLIKKLLVLFLLSLTSSVYSQDTGYKDTNYTSHPEYIRAVIRSVPRLTVEFDGHYNFGIFELSADNNGDFSSSQFIDGQNFGVRQGYGLTAMCKLNIQREGHFRLTFFGSFNRFSSGLNKVLANGGEGVFANYNVYSTGIGVENCFTPTYKFKPLVGIGLIGSVIGGSARVVEEDGVTYRDLNINPAFRLGVMVYSGFEYLLNNRFGFNCGLKLTHANLWLKNTKASDNPNDINLNDQRVSPRLPYSGWRQFVWGELYAGINYYFGISQKVYIIKKTLR